MTSARRNLVIEQGSTFSLNVQWLDDEGVPQEIPVGSEVEFHIGLVGKASPVISLSLEGGISISDNRLTIEILGDWLQMLDTEGFGEFRDWMQYELYLRPDEDRRIKLLSGHIAYRKAVSPIGFEIHAFE